MASGMGSSCGACKFLRRRCADGCVFAPYFSYDHGAIHFSAVHKVFGASNVSKLLSQLQVHRRAEAAITISFEAQARMRDPIYGCVSQIFALQQQVTSLQEEIESLTVQLASISPEISDPSSQAMDGHFRSFQLGAQRGDWIYSDSSNLNAMNSNGFQDCCTEGNLQALPPMHREAIYQLERSLLSDFGADYSASWEDLSVNTMEDLA